MNQPVFNFAVPNLNIKAASYSRLSREDGDNGVSESIENQKKIIRNYALEKNIYIVKEYADDGYTGTNFNRPGFQQMLRDIESGKINCVITKDLSRLGREYIMTGYYIETYFPENNIRYIAINDRVDSDEGDNDIIPFMNVFNEFHAKETSRKIRSVFASKFKDGECHYNAPPMGYIKDPEKKNHLIPDPETSWIIRKIFALADEGKGPWAIRTWLFENKVITPGYRAYLNWGRYASTYVGAPDERKYEWGLATVKRMICDTVYIGTLTHYKKRTPSFKNKKVMTLPKEKHLIIEKTHEPLIDIEQFERVQEKINKRKRSVSSMSEPHVFAGIAVCGTCGYGMRYLKNKKKDGRLIEYLYCGRRSEIGTKACKSHYVRYDHLCEAILSRIQALYNAVRIDKQAMAKKLADAGERNDSNERASLEKEMQNLNTRKNELLGIMTKLYEDSATGKINEEIFNMMSKKFKDEYDEIIPKIESLLVQINASPKKENQVDKLIKLIDSLSYPTKLTGELVNLLIDKVVIHESVGEKYEKGKKRQIDIYWKFVEPQNKESIFK